MTAWPFRSPPPWAGCALAWSLAGCNIVVPNAQITTVNYGTASTTQPGDPWPTRSPSTRPSAALSSPAHYAGDGPQERLGPLTLEKGHVTLEVRFASTIAGSGHFRLALCDREGRFVQTLLDSDEGSFERTSSPDIAISGPYLLAVEAADGAWTVDLSPETRMD